MTITNGLAKLTLFAVISLSPLNLAHGQSAISDNVVDVGGQTVRYLSAGTEGEAIILLHGWPQTADEFKAIIPSLAEHHRVYAPDLSGIGGSTAPNERWDKASLAADVKAFADHLDLDDPLVVGHDIGGMVAYAYGRQYPDDVSGVAILDVPIPGLDPADAIATSPHAWHYDFHNQVGLAEGLVQGRQAEYFSYFIGKVAANARAISTEDIQTYAKAYESPESLRAGFELYRAFDVDAVFFKGHDETFTVPMLVVGAEFSTGALLPVMEQSFIAQGAAEVTTLMVKGSGHWLAEEQPAATSKAIEDFATVVFDN